MNIIVRNTFSGIYDTFCMILDECDSADKNDAKKIKDYLKRYKELIGRNIHVIREELGLSFNRLYLASGISPSTLLRLEKAGGDPRYETLEKLAAAFTKLGKTTYVQDFLRDDFKEYEDLDSFTVSPSERRILTSMQSLSEKGQEIAAERVEELSKIPEYRKIR